MVYFARLDRAHVLSPLFRPLRKGERAKEKLYVKYYVERKNFTMECVGPEPLGTDDEDVFLAIVALAGMIRHSLELGVEPKSDAGMRMRVAMQAQGRAKYESMCLVETSVPEILRLAGKSTEGSANWEHVRASLRRLASVTIHITFSEWESSQHLLAFERDGRGKVCVCLNTRLASVLLQTGVEHAVLYLSERKTLKSGCAKVLHRWLCGWLGLGLAGNVKLDTLIPHVWPEPCSPVTWRQRRATIRRALNEIGTLPGWTVEFAGDQQVCIHRPSKAK